MTAWLTGIAVGVLLLFSTFLGYLSQPFAPFWLKGHNEVPPPMVVELVQSTSEVPPQPFVPIPGTSSHLTDAQRFQLARGAGWTLADAIIATAISIAENGSGDPAAMSGRNKNGTFDLGMWQINSAWWPQFGGQQALIDPWRNAQAAYYIYGRQHWCAWSTYGPCPTHPCGPPCYSSFLTRATEASRQLPPPGEA